MANEAKAMDAALDRISQLQTELATVTAARDNAIALVALYASKEPAR